MKKYELTSETTMCSGRILHRIRALVSFSNVDAGELGGWIENENNLGQYDDAWVYDKARVFDNARVCGNAAICGSAIVSGNAWVSGQARVFDNARVCGNAWVYGDAEVYGNARVSGDTEVYGHARIYGDTKVSNHARVADNAEVYGDARVAGNASIMTISHIGSRFDTTTFFALKNGEIGVQCGCFYGDIDQFAARVEQTHGDNQHGKAYKLAIELAKLHIQTRKE